MVSFDVKSLFTSIPVDLTLTITRDRVQQDQKRTYKYVCQQRYEAFRFCSNSQLLHHYKQIFGCAMGWPISPVLTDLVMEEIEETAITTALHLPKWWFRYVHDSHVYLKKDRRRASPTSKLNQRKHTVHLRN